MNSYDPRLLDDDKICNKCKLPKMPRQDNASGKTTYFCPRCDQQKPTRTGWSVMMEGK